MLLAYFAARSFGHKRDNMHLTVHSVKMTTPFFCAQPNKCILQESACEALSRKRVNSDP